jgi:hypothetical protein
MSLLDSWVTAKKTLASADALVWYRKWGLYVAVGLGTLLILALVVKQSRRKDALAKQLRASARRSAALRIAADNAWDSKKVKALRKQYVEEARVADTLAAEREALSKERALIESVIFKKKTVEELDAVLAELK